MFFNDRVFAKEMDATRQATLQLHRSLLEKEVVRLETRLALEIELRRLLEAALGYGDKVLLESSQMKQEIPVETSDLLSDVLWLESTVSSLETQACELREQVDFARSQRETLATQKYINESQDSRNLTLQDNLDDIKTQLNGIEAATKVHSSSHDTPPAGSDKPVSLAASPKTPTSSSSKISANAAPRSKSRRPLLPKSAPLDNFSSTSTSTYSVKRQQDKPRTPASSSWTTTSSSSSRASSSSSSKSNLFSGKLYASVDVPNVAYLLKNQTKHTANRIIRSFAYRRREQAKSLDAGTA